MDWRKYADWTALVGFTAASRWLTRSHALYDVDSVNFALALDHFDPAVHQPHPPGYFLYVLLGRVARSLTGDSNSALVAVSVVASCGLAVLIYLLAKEWFGTGAGRIAGVLFVLSPLVWFHGTVALTYIVEAFFSALIGWFCWRALAAHSSRYAIAAGVALGLSAGFRQSSALFLAPLVLYAVIPQGWRMCVKVGSAAAGVVAAWFIPMLWNVGTTRYFRALWDLWSIVPGTESVVQSNIAMSVARAATILFILVLCFGPAAALFLMRIPAASARRQNIFLAIWMVPATLFFTLVFLRFVNSGYLLLITPPLFALLGGRAESWYRSSAQRAGPILFALLIAATNLTTYFAAPLYCSFASVRQFERNLDNAVKRVRSAARPEDTVLVGFDSHFLGYRHAAYYLPEYRLLQYPELKYPAGPRVFTVRERRTEVVASLDVSGFRNVAFFPLPDESGYREYWTKVTLASPMGALTPVRTPDGELTEAPLSALTQLFPLTVETPKAYTPVHTLSSGTY